MGHMYSGPAGLAGYEWLIISGSATIEGASNSQTVSIKAGAACGEFVLQLKTTGVNGCTSTSTKILTISDTIAPVITATGTGANNANLGCNPTADAINAGLGTATATDNCCVGAPTADVVVTGCNRSQTRTWNVNDACGNPAIAGSFTITWTVDTVAPVITATATGANNANLGCNPTADAINAALGTATTTDNCSVGAPTVKTAAVVATVTVHKPEHGMLMTLVVILQSLLVLPLLGQWI